MPSGTTLGGMKSRLTGSLGSGSPQNQNLCLSLQNRSPCRAWTGFARRPPWRTVSGNAAPGLMSHDDTANALADAMADLNGIHPFREGSGRTQRAFIGQLALNAGYDLDFTKMSENDMRNASMAAARGNRNLMRYLFRDAMSERIYEPGPVSVSLAEAAPAACAEKRPAKWGLLAAMHAILSRLGSRNAEPAARDGPDR